MAMSNRRGAFSCDAAARLPAIGREPAVNKGWGTISGSALGRPIFMDSEPENQDEESPLADDSAKK